ncbi:MAG: M48 family metalloprotease [Rhizomicrobium sp.]
MRRLLMTGIAAAALCLVPAGVSTAKSSKPEVKKWQDLRDHPVDYSRFETRRADIAKENGAGAIGPLALGLAGRNDIGNDPVIEDAKLKAAVEAMVNKLIPPDIKPPHIEIILVDDLGIFSRLKLIPPENAEDTLEDLSAKLSSDYGAAATPGGALVLRLGTLRATKSPDELNFLLGHELSHLLYDHFKNEDREKAIQKLASIGLIAASLMSRQGSADSAKSTVEASLGLALINTLLARQWDREQEEEADELGAELAIEFGGYAPGGVYNVMQKLEDQEKEQEAALDRLCGPEHGLGHLAEDVFGGMTGVKIPPRGSNPNSPACAARKNFVSELLDQHPPAKDRDDNVRKHIALWYADLDKHRVPSPFLDAKGNKVDNFVAFASPGGDANRLALAYDGLTALREGDMAKAKRILASLVGKKAKGEKLAPVFLLQYGIAKKEGRMAEALEALEGATRTPQVYLLAFDLLAQEYEGAKRWADAARTVARWREKSDDDTLYPRLIADWREAKDTDKMTKALNGCRSNSSGQLVELCEKAALPPDPDKDHDPGKDHDKDADKPFDPSRLLP